MHNSLLSLLLACFIPFKSISLNKPFLAAFLCINEIEKESSIELGIEMMMMMERARERGWGNEVIRRVKKSVYFNFLIYPFALSLPVFFTIRFLAKFMFVIK